MTELREALDKMIAGYSYDAFERNGNNYPPARAAVEALFAALSSENEALIRERDEANYLLSEAVAEVKTQRDEVKALTEALAQARREYEHVGYMDGQGEAVEWNSAIPPPPNTALFITRWTQADIDAAKQRGKELAAKAAPQPPAQEKDK